MNCRRCGKKLNGSLKCGFCGYENVEGNVRELTHTEKNFYDGVTIEEDGTENGSNYRAENKNFRYSRTFINFGNTSADNSLIEKLLRALVGNSTLARILAAVIFIAVAVILFFIAVPILMILLGVIVGSLLYAKFIRKLL